MNCSRLAPAVSLFTAVAITFAALIPISTTSAFAQATSGTLRGVVTDAQGGVVAGATVKATNEATSVETPAVRTSGEGTYEISNLQPGRYTVTVEGSGFRRSVTTDADVKVGIINPLDIVLQAGDVAETVTVVAGTEEVIQRDQAQISASFETRKVEELPLNAVGSGIDTLVLLVPGVAQESGTGTNTNGTGFSVNGNRGRSNNFQIDGSDNNDLTVGGPSFFVGNQDQVQEYQVITNNFSAQYGRNLGSVVNIVTKSGTNEFHGSAYEFFRDRRNLDTLNNRERASGLKNPPRFLSHVFGGTVGGPIWKNRAFFFGTYQGIRQPATTQALSAGLGLLPAEATRLAADFPTNPAIQSVARLSPFVLDLGTVQPRSDLSNCNATTERLAGRPFSTCARDFVSIGGRQYETAQIERFFRTDFTQDEWSIRGDVKLTDRDNFYVRYLWQDGVSLNSLGSTNGFSGDIPFQSKNLGGTYTRQFGSKLVNEARAVYQRIFVEFGGGCEVKTPGCIPDPDEIEEAQIEGLSVSGVRGVTLTGNAIRATGMGVGFPQGRTTDVYQFADNLTYTRGSHSMIMGYEIKSTIASVPFLPRFNGEYTFNSEARLLANAPSAVNIAIGPPIVDYDEIDQYVFFQDDWRIKDNLTLNLGIRYEYTGQPINDLNDITRLRESDPTTALFNPALSVEARVVPRVPVDKNNFAPRFGFAYTPRFGSGFVKRLLGDDATVIRGGYAIAYDPAFYNILLNVSNSSPFSLLAVLGTAQLPATNSPLPLVGIFGTPNRDQAQASGVLPLRRLDPKWLSQTTVANDFYSPYSQQWSLGIQRQVNRNNVFEIRYVGNHGVGLFQNVLENPFIGVPGSATAGGLFGGFTRSVTTTSGAVNVAFPAFRNLIPSNITPLSCTDVAGTPDNEGACNGRIAPRGRVLSRSNTGQSRYDAMQSRYNGRFLNRSLNIGATYTWSKTIDTASEIFNFGTETNTAQNPFNYVGGERGLSGLHRPHIASLNFLYDVPLYKEQKGLVGHLLGGWQINGIHVYNSGRRFTPTQGFNASFLGLGGSYLTDTGENFKAFNGNPNADPRQVGISQVDAFFFFPRTTFPAVSDLNGFLSLNDLNNGIVRSITPNDVRFIINGPGAARIFGTPFGNAIRNVLEGPAINQTNLGIFKNTKVTETIRVQFRAELFNAFNHPQPGFGVVRAGSLPSTSLANAGVAGSAFAEDSEITFARRAIQFGLRIIF